jgi:hypothetical protein
MVQKIVKRFGEKCLAVGHGRHKVKVVDVAGRLELYVLVDIVPELSRKKDFLYCGGFVMRVVEFVVTGFFIDVKFFTFVVTFTVVSLGFCLLSYAVYHIHIQRITRNMDASFIAGEFFKVCVPQYFQIATREKFGIAKLFLVQKKVAVIMGATGQAILGSLICKNIIIGGT